LRPLGYPAVFRVNKVHEFILILQKAEGTYSGLWRIDILVYDSPVRRAERKVVLARWDAHAKSLDAASVIPAGAL